MHIKITYYKWTIQTVWNASESKTSLPSLSYHLMAKKKKKIQYKKEKQSQTHNTSGYITGTSVF